MGIGINGDREGKHGADGWFGVSAGIMNCGEQGRSKIQTTKTTSVATAGGTNAIFVDIAGDHYDLDNRMGNCSGVGR